MIYVTETFRFLSQPFKLQPSVLVSVKAKVSDTPEGYGSKEQTFTPEQWRALLSQPDVQHRYRKEPYQAIPH